VLLVPMRSRQTINLGFVPRAVGLTGICSPAFDGDGRGAPLSMRAVTGKPISSWDRRAMDALEIFTLRGPDRILAWATSFRARGAAHRREKAARVAERMRRVS